MDVPKALYKAQQAKGKMSKIQAAGKNGAVAVLLNGLSEVKEVEISIDELRELLGDSVSEQDLKIIAKQLSKQFKKALEDAKKALEKEMMNSADLDELKNLFGGLGG